MKTFPPLILLTFVLALFAWTPPGPALAEVWETDLSVQAAVEPWEDHVVPFAAGCPLPDITAVQLHLVGRGGGQEYIGCEAPYSWTHGYGEGVLEVGLRDSAGETGVAGAEASFGDGPRAPFDLWLDFTATDFSLLEPGTGTLRFVDPAAMVLSGQTWICPLGNGCLITSAELVIHYGDSQVPARTSTWGALKAIYR